jgi:hypothetical protein
VVNCDGGGSLTSGWTAAGSGGDRYRNVRLLLKFRAEKSVQRKAMGKGNIEEALSSFFFSPKEERRYMMVFLE